MYSIEQIKQYARTCRIFDCNSGDSCRGLLLSIAGKTVLCAPAAPTADVAGEYVWTVDGVECTAMAVQALLHAVH